MKKKTEPTREERRSELATLVKVKEAEIQRLQTEVKFAKGHIELMDAEAKELGESAVDVLQKITHDGAAD